MGILEDPIRFIRQLNFRPGFEVCELGDQFITFGERRLAKDFYISELKARKYVSIDGNGRGTYTHDLNLPLPKHFGQFDLVTDFGTGEHIFDQCQVWMTIHYLTRVGGFIVFDRPSQGYSAHRGHCYYNSHECLFIDLAHANGYDVRKLEKKETTRGELIRGVFQRIGNEKFKIPQQGRYKKLLRPITEEKKEKQ